MLGTPLYFAKNIRIRGEKTGSNHVDETRSLSGAGSMLIGNLLKNSLDFDRYPVRR